MNILILTDDTLSLRCKEHERLVLKFRIQFVWKRRDKRVDNDKLQTIS